jgi:hypothetical protein
MIFNKIQKFISTQRGKTRGVRVQTSLFNDEGNAAAIDEPIKDYPLVHFLKLGEDDTNQL